MGRVRSLYFRLKSKYPLERKSCALVTLEAWLQSADWAMGRPCSRSRWDISTQTNLSISFHPCLTRERHAKLCRVKPLDAPNLAPGHRWTKHRPTIHVFQLVVSLLLTLSNRLRRKNPPAIWQSQHATALRILPSTMRSSSQNAWSEEGANGLRGCAFTQRPSTDRRGVFLALLCFAWVWV